MARKFTGQKPGIKNSIDEDPPLAPTPRLALSIPAFCEAHDISEDFFYKLKRQGQTPRLMKVGARTLSLRQQPIGVASAKSLPQLKPQQGPPPVPGRARQSLSPHPSSSRQRIAKQTNSRAGLKHIGGYFDREDVEKVAVLRARLELDKAGWADCAVLRAVDRLNRLAAFSYLHETGEGAASTVTES